MQVMILAAGRSTRLGPLGAARPKPLVPICGYPAITFGLVSCAAAGLRDVVINLHHHGDQIRAAIGDGAAYGLRVQYSEEPELLGTGGGLVAARRLFQPGPVLVMNGKVVADLSLPQVIAAHRAAPPSNVATMVLRPNPTPDKFAPVSMDEAARVVGLRGKTGDVTAFGKVRDMMFAGVHILEAALLDRLPRAGESDVIAAAYQPALAEGAWVRGFVMTGYFEEHSTPARYLAGNLALLRRPGLVASPPGPLTGVDPSARIDATATLRPPLRLAAGAIVEAGAVVGPDVVVSGGGVVGAGARITRSVVWPGGIARGSVEDSVVMAEDVVAAGE
jgi:NDP-sugar pyrophosphorylase family protein